jgi:hypothetical protein
MRTHQHPKQGTAAHKEVHRDSGPARGPMSPLGCGNQPGHIGMKPGPESVLHRDEDYASAPMERLSKGTIPAVNQRAGVTTVRGTHGPRGTPKDQRDG